ncbi:MAG: hypothetical protein JWO38_1001 [Gemmataceae bacterium]|nr:hypothetical protein [Gemmataceae bacterium]
MSSVVVSMMTGTVAWSWSPRGLPEHGLRVPTPPWASAGSRRVWTAMPGKTNWAAGGAASKSRSLVKNVSLMTIVTLTGEAIRARIFGRGVTAVVAYPGPGEALVAAARRPGVPFY